MRISSPVDRLAEAEQLLDAGAGAEELSGGIASSALGDRFGRLMSINQRTCEPVQISNFSDFKAIVNLAADKLELAGFSARVRQACLTSFGHTCLPITCDFPESYVGE